MNCQRCGRFLRKDEIFLCEKCSKEFSKWIDRNFHRISKMKMTFESPLEIWLKEVKGNEEM